MTKEEVKGKKQGDVEMTIPDAIMWAAKDIINDPRLSNLTQEKYIPMWKYGKRISNTYPTMLNYGHYISYNLDKSFLQCS